MNVRHYSLAAMASFVIFASGCASTPVAVPCAPQASAPSSLCARAAQQELPQPPQPSPSAPSPATTSSDLMRDFEKAMTDYWDDLKRSFEQAEERSTTSAPGAPGRVE